MTKPLGPNFIQRQLDPATALADVNEPIAGLALLLPTGLRLVAVAILLRG